jgi:hypothetical protein
MFTSIHVSRYTELRQSRNENAAFICSYDRCACLSPLSWYVRSIVLPGTRTIINSTVCNLTDTCWVESIKRLTTDNSMWNKYCFYCNEECDYTEFDIKSSSLDLLPDLQVNRIKRFVERSTIELPENWNATWRTYISKSYLTLNIVSETSRIETYTQEAKMTFGDLISNIGGQTGLWIGISFLSLIEIAEMLYRVLRQIYSTLLQTIRTRRRKQTANGLFRY